MKQTPAIETYWHDCGDKSRQYIRANGAARREYFEGYKKLGLERVYVDLGDGRRGWYWSKPLSYLPATVEDV